MGVPHLGVVEVDGDVVDGSDDEGVGVDLTHPGDALVERQGLHGGGADEDGEALAAGEGRLDEMVVAGVRRIELAEDQAVSVALHAATSTGRARRAARSLVQPRRPSTQSVMKPTYSREVRYSSLYAYSGT